MKSSLLSLLRAPEDGGPFVLTVAHQDGEEIVSGTLTDGAGRAYPIEDGIPRLLPQAMLDAQKSEMAARDAQVDSYDAMALFNAFGHVEIPLVLHALAPRPNDLLLEGGCGTGRMTEAFCAACREVVAMDFSWESLKVNQRKLAAAKVTNVHLIQADLCRLPFPTDAFSRVASCGVLEHVPTDASRRQAVAELARVAQPDALLALSAYKHSLWTRAFDKKEGAHDGGIPFVRFDEDELYALLTQSFAVHSLTGVLVYYYLARCTKKSRG